MRRTWAIVASGALLVGVVSGCTTVRGALSDVDTGLGDELVVSTTPSTSTPLFLAAPQAERDALPEEASFAAVEPASSRYQGVWEGQAIYLAVTGEYQVHLITGVLGEDRTWGSSSSVGNAVLGLGLGADGAMTLQYVPHGTAEVPPGWKALSDFIIVKP